tara:strand:- start:117 stop:611 length:495 start_codon:yes stop_codon:yes gene_type:complete
MKSLSNAATVAIFLTMFSMFTIQNASADSYVTIGGLVSHVGSDGYTDQKGFHTYNERNNNILGIEVVNEETQVGLGSLWFSNSYGNEGGLLYASKYWKLNDNVKVGALGGVVYGYKDWQINDRLRIGNELHVMVAPTAKVQYENLFTQISAYGNAVVVTIGIKL